MKRIEPEQVDDFRRVFLDHSWRCPGSYPVMTWEQTEELLSLAVPWVLAEFGAGNGLRGRPKATSKGTPVSQVQRPKKTTVQQSKPPRGSSSHVPGKVRDAVLLRDRWLCQRCGVGIRKPDYSLQHRDARGMGGSRVKHTMPNLVTLCGSATTGCHGHVESERTESYALGWLVPNGASPDDWRVWRFGSRWWQPGERWVPAVPGERQLELVRESGLSGVEGGAA